MNRLLIANRLFFIYRKRMTWRNAIRNAWKVSRI
jgi:hypothetical protein